MRWLSFGQHLLSVLIIFLFCACGASRPDAPNRQAPEARPKDSSAPSFLVVVEPVVYSEEENAMRHGMATAKTIQERAEQLRQFQKGINSSPLKNHELLEPLLISALVRVGNLVVLDREFVQRSPRGTYRVIRGAYAGQKVYPIRVTITEIAQEITGSEQSINPYDFSSNRSAVQTLTQVPVMLTGFWITTLTTLPSQWYSREIVGLAAADVEITDGSTGRVISSFPVRGTHTFKLKQLGSEFGGGLYSESRGGSSSSQAIAAAFTNAASRSYDALAAESKR